MANKCYQCKFWNYPKGVDISPERWENETGCKTWENECSQLKLEVEIDLDAGSYGGGDTVGDIWTNPNWFCAGFKKREVSREKV